MRRLLTGLILAGAIAASACSDVSHAQPQVQSTAGAEAQDGEWFRQSGCTACHSLSVYNISNIAATGPDLSIAVEDVPRRFGMPLDQYLHAPPGTMAMVLSSRIPLTPAQRDVAIGKLKEAYRLHREKSGAGRPAASH